MNTIAAFVGRILLALLFIVSGINKLFDLHTTEALVASAGLPAGLALATGLFEVVGGLALVLGFMTRLFAILFAAFSLITIVYFHLDFADPMQATMALKNVAIAGGMLCLFAHSQMRWSYDSMRAARRAEAAGRLADERSRKAELRAVRAEAKADVLDNRPIVAGSAGWVDRTDAPERRRRWWDWR